MGRNFIFGDSGECFLLTGTGLNLDCRKVEIDHQIILLLIQKYTSIFVVLQLEAVSVWVWERCIVLLNYTHESK